MTTNVKPVAGTKLYIKENSGDEYTEIKEVTDLGEYGPDYEEIQHKPISTFTTYKFRGAKDYGSITGQLGQDTDDAGQILLRSLEGEQAYFKIEFPDAADHSGATPTTDEFEALIKSIKTKVGVVNNIIGTSFTLSISGDVTRTLAAS